MQTWDECPLLYRGGLFEATRVHATEELLAELHVIKIVAHAIKVALEAWQKGRHKMSSEEVLSWGLGAGGRGAWWGLEAA